MEDVLPHPCAQKGVPQCAHWLQAGCINNKYNNLTGRPQSIRLWVWKIETVVRSTRDCTFPFPPHPIYNCKYNGETHHMQMSYDTAIVCCIGTYWGLLEDFITWYHSVKCIKDRGDVGGLPRTVSIDGVDVEVIGTLGYNYLGLQLDDNWTGEICYTGRGRTSSISRGGWGLLTFVRKLLYSCQHTFLCCGILGRQH